MTRSLDLHTISRDGKQVLHSPEEGWKKNIFCVLRLPTMSMKTQLIRGSSTKRRWEASDNGASQKQYEYAGSLKLLWAITVTTQFGKSLPECLHACPSWSLRSKWYLKERQLLHCMRTIMKTPLLRIPMLGAHGTWDSMALQKDSNTHSGPNHRELVHPLPRMSAFIRQILLRQMYMVILGQEKRTIARTPYHHRWLLLQQALMRSLLLRKMILPKQSGNGPWGRSLLPHATGLLVTLKWSTCSASQWSKRHWTQAIMAAEWIWKATLGNFGSDSTKWWAHCLSGCCKLNLTYWHFGLDAREDTTLRCTW